MPRALGPAYARVVFPTGEGAVSTGPLVAVFRPRSDADADVVIRLLERHHIPALFSSGLPQGWGVDAERREVLVPAALRGHALEVLNRAAAPRPRPATPPPTTSAAEPIVPRPPMRGAGLRALPVAATPPEVRARPAELPEEDAPPAVEDPDAWSRPIEPPEATSEARRWWAALALFAISLGIAIQVGVDRWLEPRAAIELLGASAQAWPELERWVTAGFIHGSSAHAIGNAIFGLLIGWAVFQTHGVGAAAFVWLVSSAAGIAAQTTFHPEALVIGASAGNYGLVGLWAKGQWERSRRRALPRRERLRTLGILMLLIPGAFTPFTSTGAPVAVTAHALGFCAGALAGFAFLRRGDSDSAPRIESRSRVAGLLAAVVVTVSFGWALGRLGVS